MRTVLEPIYERDFAAQSYGFRPGMGCNDALRRVDERLKAGYAHAVDADLKSYLDTIPKDRLLTLVAGKATHNNKRAGWRPRCSRKTSRLAPPLLA